MTTIKAIGFDFGGVIGGDPNIGREFSAASAKLLGCTVDEWRKTYFSLNQLLNTGKTSKHDFWRQFLAHFGQQDKLNQVIAQDGAMAARYMVVNQSIITLIDRLRTAGYKVGLLSNASGEVAEQIRWLAIQDHFDSFLFSVDLELQKPDPKAFLALAISLGVDITELVFIDDASKSLATAQECGFAPILFRSLSQLENDLHLLGVTY